jgi:hypothetical protein
MNAGAGLTDINLANALQGAGLVDALNLLARRGPLTPTLYATPGSPPIPPFSEALKALDAALKSTIKHMKQQEDGKATTLTNDEIANLWGTAGHAVYYYDPALSNACMMKGNGWIDADVWTRARAQGLKIGIEEMEQARMALNTKFGNDDGKPPPPASVPSWFPIVGALFAAVFFGFLIYTFIVGIPTDPQRRLVFDVLVAFSLAASGAFLGGTAVASGNIPFFKDSPVKFSAVGGIGIFVVVLMIMKYAV